MQLAACSLFSIFFFQSTSCILAAVLKRDVATPVSGFPAGSTQAEITSAAEEHLAHTHYAEVGIGTPMTSSDDSLKSVESLAIFIDDEMPGGGQASGTIVHFIAQGTAQQDNELLMQTTDAAGAAATQSDFNALAYTAELEMTAPAPGTGDVVLQTDDAVYDAALSVYVAPAYTTAADEAGALARTEEVSLHTAGDAVADAEWNAFGASPYTTTDFENTPSQEGELWYTTEASAADMSDSKVAADDANQIIGRCGSDDASKKNLLSDGGFECMTGGPNFNDTRWSFPEGTTPFDEFCQSGNASLRVPYAFNSTITVVQTIRLEGDTALPIYVQAFATYDDHSVPVVGMDDSDHSLRVHLIGNDDTAIQREIMTFNQYIPWQWTPTVREIRPVAPYRQIKVELFYKNDRAKWTVGEQGYIWYDVVTVRFKATAGQSSDFPGVVNNVASPASVEGARGDTSSGSVSQTIDIIIGCTASLCVVLLAVLVAFLWRWRSRTNREAAAWNVPDWVGPDHARRKEHADKMGDGRSMYSVGTALSEQVRQWRIILARTENKRKLHRDHIPMPSNDMTS